MYGQLQEPEDDAEGNGEDGEFFPQPGGEEEERAEEEKFFNQYKSGGYSTTWANVRAGARWGDTDALLGEEKVCGIAINNICIWGGTVLNSCFIFGARYTMARY